MPIRTAPGNAEPTRIPNGLLREYLPKGTELSGYTQREFDAIAHRMNTQAHGNVSTLRRRSKCTRSCAIIHPVHVELETARLIIEA